MHEQLDLMLSLQEGVNSVIDPHWRERGNAWHRAVWMECAEILERDGDWKWWQAPSPRESAAEQADTLRQQQIELCDIWHFILSWALQQRLGAATLLPAKSAAATENKHVAVEAMVRHAVNQDLTALVASFYRACRCYALDFDQLFRLYVGKNVVNRFRQDRGYRQGTYQKHFGGREDNVHLAEILDELAADNSLDLPDKLYERLDARYRQSSHS